MPRQVRFRTLGCYPLDRGDPLEGEDAARDHSGNAPDQVLASGREALIDFDEDALDGEASKREGYF